MNTIRNLSDLCAFFCADTPASLNRRIYKGTACGASISLELPDRWIHNGDRDPAWATVTDAECTGFTIQTIVEGSDATVDSEPFRFPVTVANLDGWIEYMENEANSLWHEANDDDDDE